VLGGCISRWITGSEEGAQTGTAVMVGGLAFAAVTLPVSGPIGAFGLIAGTLAGPLATGALSAWNTWRPVAREEKHHKAAVAVVLQRMLDSEPDPGRVELIKSRFRDCTWVDHLEPLFEKLVSVPWQHAGAAADEIGSNVWGPLFLYCQPLYALGGSQEAACEALAALQDLGAIDQALRDRAAALVPALPKTRKGLAWHSFAGPQPMTPQFRSLLDRLDPAGATAAYALQSAGVSVVPLFETLLALFPRGRSGGAVHAPQRQGENEDPPSYAEAMRQRTAEHA